MKDEYKVARGERKEECGRKKEKLVQRPRNVKEVERRWT